MDDPFRVHPNQRRRTLRIKVAERFESRLRNAAEHGIPSDLAGNDRYEAGEFAQAVDVTGVVLTKLDGSAKGGIVVAIHSELGVPVKLVGLGEGVNDLVEFDESEFVAALFE